VSAFFPQAKFYGRIFYLSTVASPGTRHLFEVKAEVAAGTVPGGASWRPWFHGRGSSAAGRGGESSIIVLPEEAVRATERGFVVVYRPKVVARRRANQARVRSRRRWTSWNWGQRSAVGGWRLLKRG